MDLSVPGMLLPLLLHFLSRFCIRQGWSQNRPVSSPGSKQKLIKRTDWPWHILLSSSRPDADQQRHNLNSEQKNIIFLKMNGTTACGETETYFSGLTVDFFGSSAQVTVQLCRWTPPWKGCGCEAHVTTTERLVFSNCKAPHCAKPHYPGAG